MKSEPFVASLSSQTLSVLQHRSLSVEQLQGVWPKIIPVTIQMPIFYVNFSTLNYPNLNEESLEP